MQKVPIKKGVPENLQGILWSASVKSLDLERDKNYIIHQVLAYGTLEQIRWLFGIYGREQIRRVFLEHPQNIYTSSGLYFIQVILGLEDIPLKKSHYVKDIFRGIDRGRKKDIS